MITIGIHIGHFSIHISQSYLPPSNPCVHFETVDWPSHAHMQWYACYGGALPNAFDPSNDKIGYDAIDELGPVNAPRLNSDFFRAMLDDGPLHELACRVWAELGRYLRNHAPALRIRETVKAVLVLDGVDLSAPVNKWMPWQQGKDRTPEILKELTDLGSRAGFAEYEIASDQLAIERYAATKDGLRPSDMVALVGGAHTILWEITSESGKLRPLCRTVGISHLMEGLARSKEFSEDTVTNTLRFLREPGLQPIAWEDIERWQRKQLFPAIFKGLRQASTMAQEASRRLFVVGEGAALLQGMEGSGDRFQVEPWQRDHLYVPAHGAAILALEHASGTAE